MFVKWGWHQNTPFRVCDDQNGDGFNDILIINLEENQNFAKIFPGGPLIDSIPFWQVKTFTRAVTIDINGDGHRDIVTFPYAEASHLAVYLYGDPDFSLTERFSFQQDMTGKIGSGLTFYSRIIADFNGDGKDDWLHPNDGQYLYFYGYMVNSGGYPPTEFPTAYRGLNTQDRGEPGAFKMDVGDVNGDGLQDLMLGIGYDEQWLWLGGAHNIDNTADKKFYGATGRGFVGDVTGDGVDDLALVYDYEGHSS